MRIQVTFILRLWIDPEAAPSTWEGQVECLADGERTHVRGGEELARFVAAHATPPAASRPVPAPAEQGNAPEQGRYA